MEVEFESPHFFRLSRISIDASSLRPSSPRRNASHHRFLPPQHREDASL